QNPMDLDYLVLSAGADVDAESLPKLFSFETLILDSSYPRYKKENLKKIMAKHNIPVHDVVENGAFIVDLQADNIY
ncbi:MAG: hypothetical protein ACP5DZ_06350, partial [Bacteroidales bacterium]